LIPITEATDQMKDIGIAAGDERIPGAGGLEDKGRKYGTRGKDTMGGRGDLLEDSKFRHGREISKGDHVREGQAGQCGEGHWDVVSSTCVGG